MTTQIYAIDWRREFARLKPRMVRRGGVVRIRHSGDICAWKRFDAILKQDFAALPAQSASIRVDSHWHTTRYLEDILNEFDRKLIEAGSAVSAMVPDNLSADVAVMSGNHVSGSAEFNIGTLNLGSSSASQTRRRDARVADVCRRCGELLAKGVRLLVVVHHGLEKTQASFWRDLWQRGLSDLTSQGMLLVHYVAEGDAINLNAPDPDDEITLPRDLSEESREGDAYDDLIDMLMTFELTKPEAAAMAMGHINSNKHSMHDFYNNLATLVLRIRPEPNS